MITVETYTEIRARIDLHDTWVNTLRKQTKCRACRGTGKQRYSTDCCGKCFGRGYTLGWASYKPEDKPQHVPDVTNEERSAIEVYEFKRDKPQRYFAYVDEVKNVVTTWTGELLGNITWSGSPYQVSSCGGWSSERQNLRIQAVNGVTYSAVYYKSSGSYCRMKAFKNSMNGAAK